MWPCHAGPAATNQHCEYGALPGRWVVRNETAPTWRLLDATCNLRPLLPAAASLQPPTGGLLYMKQGTIRSCARARVFRVHAGVMATLHAPAANACKLQVFHITAGSRRPGLLLIGDSVDRRLVEAACPHDPGYFAQVGPADRSAHSPQTLRWWHMELCTHSTTWTRSQAPGDSILLLERLCLVLGKSRTPSHCTTPAQHGGLCTEALKRRQLIAVVSIPEAASVLQEGDEGPAWRSLWCSLPGLHIAMYPIWGILARGKSHSVCILCQRARSGERMQRLRQRAAAVKHLQLDAAFPEATSCGTDLA